MIVQITGNVTYPITLDPTVWIFDDRKVLFDTLFSEPSTDYDEEDKRIEENFTPEERSSQRVKPPVNKSINRFEREKILQNSYVMPLSHFIIHTDVHKDATQAILETDRGQVPITIEQLETCYLLFSIKGKPIKENGPVHIYFEDGTNKDSPITGVKKIVIQ